MAHVPFGTQPDPRLLAGKTDEAIRSVRDITERAKAMRIGLAAYPVAEIELLLAKAEQ